MDSDCSTDPDEQLPVFDFLQPAGRSRAEEPRSVHLHHADAAAASSPGRGSRGVCTATADVTMISSSSDDDDEPSVPLAQRIKQKRDNETSASSVATDGRDAEPVWPSRLPGSWQGREMGCGQELAELPLKRARSRDVSPARRRPGRRAVEEIQASREEAPRGGQARERQQRDKDMLREERERQKTERKAVAEAAKALRPEECMKHMVVVVDPGTRNLKPGLTVNSSQMFF